MNIENTLREYMHKKSIVDTTLARIEQYKYAICHPEMIIENRYSTTSKELGMPGSPLRNTSSSVEKAITDKELTVEILREWIREDESKIFFLRLEVEQIQTALKSLTSQEEYIIGLKYFDGMFWRDIELSFNTKFRQKNHVTFEQLKKLNKKALSKLEEILVPFYRQYKTA